MISAPTFEDVIGCVAAVGRSPGVAPAILICDSSALRGLGAVLDETRATLTERNAWRTAAVPTSPEGRALKLPNHVVHVFRRSATQLDLLAMPGEVTTELWERIENAEHQIVDSLHAPSGIVCVSLLDALALELAAAVPSLTGDTLALGDMGLEGMLLRVEPGEYVVSYARRMLDEYEDVELYRVRRA